MCEILYVTIFFFKFFNKNYVYIFFELLILVQRHDQKCTVTSKRLRTTGLKEPIVEIVGGKRGEEGPAENGKRRGVQSDLPERDHGLW